MTPTKLKTFLLGLAAALVFATSSSVGAAMLSLNAPEQVSVGDRFDVVLDVSDLQAPGLGAFTIDVTFDSALFALEEYALGPDLLADDDLSLGDLGDFVALGWLAFFGPVVDGPDARLASLTFTATAQGTGAFGFGLVELVDGSLSDPGLIDVRLEGTAVASAAAVPAPATVAMLAMGIAGLLGMRRRAG